MNEEMFKRLQDQCWIYHTHPDMIDTDSNGEARPCGFDTKKFAELIVRECLFIIDDERKPDMVNRTELWHQIVEHFGVK